MSDRTRIHPTPRTTSTDVDQLLDEILGDLATSVTVESISNDEATASPTATPLWDALDRQIRHAFPSGRITPRLAAGATDGRFFRRHGAVAYGAGLFSPAVDTTIIGQRFHGNDERIDIESLNLCTELWDGVARDVLG